MILRDGANMSQYLCNVCSCARVYIITTRTLQRPRFERTWLRARLSKRDIHELCFRRLCHVESRRPACVPRTTFTSSTANFSPRRRSLVADARRVVRMSFPRDSERFYRNYQLFFSRSREPRRYFLLRRTYRRSEKSVDYGQRFSKSSSRILRKIATTTILPRYSQESAELHCPLDFEMIRVPTHVHSRTNRDYCPCPWFT